MSKFASILGVMLVAFSFLAAEPQKPLNCHCKNCKCTPENHCGCYSKSGCPCKCGEHCECPVQPKEEKGK